MIIDVHAHVGVCRVFDEANTEADVLGAMNKHGVDISIVQPLFGTIDIETVMADHDRVYRMTQANPGRIYGMAGMNPHMKVSDYKRENRRCMKELGFVGIKLHPGAHACSPDSKDGIMAIETAAELDVPVMVHTGAGIPAALPANVIGVAKKYPEVRFVLAHCGMIIGSGEALLAAQECPNVYLETSWCVPHHIEGFVAALGAERIMFAADEFLNVGAEVAKYKDLRITEEQRAQCLYKTAAAVYRLSV